MSTINYIYHVYWSEAEAASPAQPASTSSWGLAAFAVAALMVSSVPETSLVPAHEIRPLEDGRNDLTLAETVERFRKGLPRSRRHEAYRLGKLVLELSERHQISPSLIMAVIETESSFRSSVVSKAGAVGLMQLLPGTAREMATRYKVRAYHGPADLHDPAVNLQLGVAYLAHLRRQFGHTVHYVAAYNLGPTALRRRLGAGNYELGALDRYVRVIHERARSLREAGSERPWPRLRREQALLAASL